jgi:dipeptidyl aminopeptidase/acylaminoacyl peptidase
MREKNIMKRTTRRLILILGIVLFLILFLIPFGLSVMIYEDNFGSRFETYAPKARSMEEFPGLQSQKYSFPSKQGQKLAGYRYYRETEEAKGVILIAHGLGGGGHNSYMDVADYFVSHGYVVFAYDATGNDDSEGSSVRGLPQGIIDLDYAIRFVKQNSDFKELPILLFGHSWGAYSSGSVLKLHPDIKAVVMVAGFNRSMDIIEEEGRRMAGDAMSVLMPYLSLYERIKMGRYASYSCIEGFEASDSGVMIIHSSDDEMISKEISFDVFENRYQENPRFRFVSYEDRGHNYVYYSDEAREYIDTFNQSFDQYIDSLDEEFTPDIKASYLKDNLDKKQLYDLDEELMDRMIDFYDTMVQK